MRVFSGVLACIGIGAVSVVLADPAEAPKSSAPAETAEAQTSVPPSPSTAATPAAPVNPATAPTAATVTAAADSGQEQLERHFLSEGYKSEMHGSQKVFCRREETLGTRLGATKNCGTVDQLKQQEDMAARATHDIQRNGPRPTN